MADNTNPAPSAEDEFGVSAEDEFGVNSTSFGGGFADALFQNVKPFSTILNNIGAGIEQGWNAAGDEKETLNKISDTDYLKSKNEYIKGINDHFIRPAAYLATLVGQAPFRAVTGFGGGIYGLAEGTAESLGGMYQSIKENPNISDTEKLAAWPLGAVAELSGIAASMPDLGGEFFGGHGNIETMTAKARATASVGEGERGFFNTVPVSPENLNARLEASQAAGMADLPPIEPPQTDLHSVSRLMAPDLFQEWDNLKELKDNLRLSMDYLSGKRGEDQERAITTILARTGGDESALSDSELSRLNNARNLLEQSKSTESVQMAETRQRLAEADVKLRDLLPKLQDVKERTQAVLEGTDKESDAFRDFVQARALENSIKLQELQDKVILDENGKPLKVYHGTPTDFDNFQGDTFFTSNQDHAKFFAGEKGRVVPAHLSLKNPLVVDFADPANSQYGAIGFSKVAIATAKKQGHDGLIIKNFRDNNAGSGDVYVSFDPNQIKSPVPDFKTETHQKLVDTSIKLQELQDKVAETYRNADTLITEPEKPESLNSTPGNRPGLKEIPGTGKTKTRGLAKTVESEAIEKGLTESFSNLPEYSQINLKDQANKVTDLINSDPKLAFQIAMGKVPAPTGVIPEMVFNGIKDIARDSNDTETLRQLATESDLVRQSTVMAQRLRALAEGIDNTDPVAAMKVIQDARQSLLDSANIKASKQRIIKAAKDALKNSAPKADEWNAFLDDLTCK